MSIFQRVYKPLKIQSDYEYAVALLLTDQLLKPPFISFTSGACTEQCADKKLPAALEFLKWFLHSSEKELMQNTNHQTVRWCKK